MNSLIPLVIGHRGAAGEAPENTLASFQLALEQGADGIELDVHMSKDEEIVVCHDPTLDRTTTGSGRLRAMPLSEIRRFDAGSWHSKRFQGERVPLLDEVFELVPEHILINIEIKDSYSGLMETKLLDVLRKKNRLNQVVISSFDAQCVRHTKELEPEVKVGILYNSFTNNHVQFAKKLGVELHSLHPHYQRIGKGDVSAAVAAGLSVYPYTVNAIEDIRKMIDYRVSGVITDYPAKMVELLKQSY
ncbi:glycerophosphodiester phosphodiesterase [Paenibacillus eucommiae]|uniref:Glycerophosphoryl diester phosphodiesterase n=1 Tax=Paenibacillus eucommiae TaxID=1355755 RepID=A0ABS4J766_9BACL|nr:glycerophosphodiester phosphodiesterase [Paenibacillus eucommiae]MBP1995678.1 glycerophosphoryl diester phosphodiesterase [Paenibacillus eucommiae]